MSDYRLRQRGGVYQVEYRLDGRRVRTSLHTSDLKLAERLARDHVAKARAGGAAWTLGAAVEYTVTNRWAGSRGEVTATTNAEDAVRFYGASCPLERISGERLDEYVRWLQERGAAGATINRKLAALRTVLQVAHDRGALMQVPKMPRRREAPHRIRWLTPAEEHALLLELDTPCDERAHESADLVRWLLDTGMRLGEALRLAPRDIDLAHNVVHVWETKADKPRTIPLTPRARAVASVRMGRPKVWRLSYTAFNNRWEAARKRMGLEDDPQFVPHACRHTFASRLVQAGQPLVSVQTLLGHRSIMTTMRYSHVGGDQLHQAIQALVPEGASAAPTLKLVR